MSAARRNARAAIKAVEIPAHNEARQAAKGKPQTRAPMLAKEPSARPYREPEPVLKEKRVVRAVSDRDGLNLLRKIEVKGGRDIIVMMCHFEGAPQELAEELMLNESIVITSLNTYGSGKNQRQRLLVAIGQAANYLKTDDTRPVTTGVRKQKRQEAAQARQDEIASLKKKPRTRVFVTPTLAEVVPRKDDQQIVVEELKQYLGLNVVVRNRVMGASSDQKAARILMFNVGQGFDARVKALIALPSEYQDLLAEAGAIIRRDVRKYDTSSAASSGVSSSSTQELPEVIAQHQAQQDVWENYKRRMDTRAKPVQVEAHEPEVEERRELFSHQEDVLRKHLEARDQPS